jgi:hypothetical protein
MKTFSQFEGVVISFNIVWLQEAERRFGVEMSSDSVIHLVENLDTNSDTSGQHVTQSVQTLCVANIETVTQVVPMCFVSSILNISDDTVNHIYIKVPYLLTIKMTYSNLALKILILHIYQILF